MIEFMVATSQHAKQISGLEDELFLFNKFSYNEIVNEIENKNRHYIVAVSKNAVIGYAGLNLSVDFAEIMKIGVNKKHQNKGVATSLLNNLVDFCKLQNLNKITLEVSNKNLPAISFYKKHGFKKIHIRENYYHDSSSAIILELNI